MKYISQGVKVGILTMVMIFGSYGVWKAVSGRPSGDSNYDLWAKFADASGLPDGSVVMVAGLPIGEITSRSIVGNQARVNLRIRTDIVVWNNSIAYKKSTSLLGNYYIEIDPGGPNSPTRGKPLAKLVEGDQIPLVVEATSPDQLMRRIAQTMPKVDDVLLSVRDLSEDLRKIVKGPLTNIMSRIDDLIQSEADTVSSILARTDRTIARIELITQDVRNITKGADKKVNAILDELELAAKDARELMKTARSEVELTGTAVREKLDLVDDLLASSSSIARKIDEDEGTLGRLVNDSTLADNLTDISEDAKGFLGTLFGMQTYVGLRSEYAFRGGGVRSYISIEIETRPDKFYLIEFVKGPRGTYPEIILTCGTANNPCTKTFIIEDKIRFTFQFAKRMGWATLRYGIKESSGGVGLDATLMDSRLKFSLDVFDGSFNRFPRLKVAAAYQVWRNLYVLGGIDDALNESELLPIADDGFDIPTQFDEDNYHFGRDLFLGAQLRFNDKDLAALLFIGGAALSGALD